MHRKHTKEWRFAIRRNTTAQVAVIHYKFIHFFFGDFRNEIIVMRVVIDRTVESWPINTVNIVNQLANDGHNFSLVFRPDQFFRDNAIVIQVLQSVNGFSYNNKYLFCNFVAIILLPNFFSAYIAKKLDNNNSIKIKWKINK